MAPKALSVWSSETSEMNSGSTPGVMVQTAGNAYPIYSNFQIKRCSKGSFDVAFDHTYQDSLLNGFFMLRM
jgi:hypothetical protein